MEHVEQVAQIKTLMARLDTGTNVDAGGLRRNPTSVYVDPELAERERSTFFDQHPQLVGLSGDLPEPGSFLTLHELGVPILATRDADGRFRAFVNSCRHRGVILERETRGSARRFTCEFHSWVYDSGGTLVGLPKEDHFGQVDRECLGLVELPAEERHGLLFVHPQPDGSLDVDALLGQELSAELASWDLGRLRYLGADRYDVACNWKLAMDTFGETYHFDSPPRRHPGGSSLPRQRPVLRHLRTAITGCCCAAGPSTSSCATSPEDASGTSPWPPCRSTGCSRTSS